MDQFDHTPYRYQIYEKLREKIVYKGWKSGTMLSEGDLAKSFGTSRTPIREAVRQLEAEGLVKVIPKKGILISTINEKDIKEKFDNAGVNFSVCFDKANNFENSDICGRIKMTVVV